MEDKILKQIEEEAVKFSKSNYADSIPNEYIEELSFIAGAKYGYNIKESVDEKLVEALKEVWKHMNAYIPEKVFDLVEEALLSAQNTVSNEGEKCDCVYTVKYNDASNNLICGRCNETTNPPKEK